MKKSILLSILFLSAFNVNATEELRFETLEAATNHYSNLNDETGETLTVFIRNPSLQRATLNQIIDSIPPEQMPGKTYFAVLAQDNDELSIYGGFHKHTFIYEDYSPYDPELTDAEEEMLGEIVNSFKRLGLNEETGLSIFIDAVAKHKNKQAARSFIAKNIEEKQRLLNDYEAGKINDANLENYGTDIEQEKSALAAFLIYKDI